MTSTIFEQEVTKAVSRLKLADVRIVKSICRFRIKTAIKKAMIRRLRAVSLATRRQLIASSLEVMTVGSKEWAVQWSGFFTNFEWHKLNLSEDEMWLDQLL